MADMYKNQLQELAQRSCFNLPSYACIREGPDHAPRFRASVNFNGEIFEGPTYCTTLRQAEHSAAQVALNVLSSRGPSKSLTARVLDETGVYKNLLQETAHRAGLKLPVYTTVRSGPGHVPVFTCNVELAGMNFTGENAKTKKQAEKNAAIAAWSSLKRMPNLVSLSQKDKIVGNGEKPDPLNMGKVLPKLGTKGENRSIRRRDQNQAAGRRMQGQKRLLDLLMDFSASECSTPNKSSFVSLLPPPPPRTTSMILPQTPSNFSKSPVKMQGVAPPLDEHQRDEDEWLNGKSEFIKKPIERDGLKKSTCFFYGENPRNNVRLKSLIQPDHKAQSEEIHLGKRVLGAPTQSQIGRSNGGCYYPQRFALAVQIRSVIPVCAAPPPSSSSMRPSNSPLMKQVALTSPSAVAGKSMSTVHNGAAAEVSSATTNPNSYGIVSMLNNKLQF